MPNKAANWPRVAFSHSGFGMVVTVFSIHLFRADGDQDRSPSIARVGIIGIVLMIFNSSTLNLVSILQLF
jgi:hypothetical protein